MFVNGLKENKCFENNVILKGDCNFIKSNIGWLSVLNIYILTGGKVVKV